jgi:hypothetical protein
MLAISTLSHYAFTLRSFPLAGSRTASLRPISPSTFARPSRSSKTSQSSQLSKSRPELRGGVRRPSVTSRLSVLFFIAEVEPDIDRLSAGPSPSLVESSPFALRNHSALTHRRVSSSIDPLPFSLPLHKCRGSSRSFTYASAWKPPCMIPEWSEEIGRSLSASSRLPPLICDGRARKDVATDTHGVDWAFARPPVLCNRFLDYWAIRLYPCDSPDSTLLQSDGPDLWFPSFARFPFQLTRGQPAPPSEDDDESHKVARKLLLLGEALRRVGVVSDAVFPLRRPRPRRMHRSSSEEVSLVQRASSRLCSTSESVVSASVSSC